MNGRWSAHEPRGLDPGGRERRAAEHQHGRIARVNAWVRRREHVIVVGLFAGVGAYLVVKGIVTLAS
jgi:hypothetical protein